MEQKKVLLEVNHLLDTYCEQCFLNSYFKKEYGKCYAQRFCIHECTVGQKLKKYGEKLS
ncbi:zinc-finger domain-containing protein [Bacillus salitolerans]|uniref:Zinc-finger domain-containing protein n=1 Tax=Bacillus salitolerans TaxID=1437434 RepID=A0ABW4LV14_9BACI